MKKLLHPSTKLLLAAFVCCFSVAAFAQKAPVHGTVTDADGSPLIGATVVVMDGTRPEGGGNYDRLER